MIVISSYNLKPKTIYELKNTISDKLLLKHISVLELKKKTILKIGKRIAGRVQNV